MLTINYGGCASYTQERRFKMGKMAKIKITLDKMDNLLSIMLRVGHKNKILRTSDGDDKAMMDENAIMGVLHVIEMLTGKVIGILPAWKYPQSYPEDYYCYTLELPVSECGKYLLIDNPLSMDE